MWHIDFSDAVTYSLIWALLQENRKKKATDSRQKHGCEETEISIPSPFQPWHSSPNHSPCLKGSWVVVPNLWSEIFKCFRLFFVVLLKSNMSVTWRGVVSNLQLWTVRFIFSETIQFFYVIFSFPCAEKLQGWREYVGGWSNYKVRIW